MIAFMYPFLLNLTRKFLAVPHDFIQTSVIKKGNVAMCGALFDALKLPPPKKKLGQIQEMEF